MCKLMLTGYKKYKILGPGDRLCLCEWVGTVVLLRVRLWFNFMVLSSFVGVCRIIKIGFN